MGKLAFKRTFVFILFYGYFHGVNANRIQSFECPNNQIVAEGLNKKWSTQSGPKRQFHAEFPNAPKATPIGVIFSWHGLGSDTEKWRNAFPLADYSSPRFPFIVITPHDLALKPIGTRKGIGWDLLKSLEHDDNLEAKLFESILSCLSRSHNISEAHIYMAGFSGGAIVSNMLHSRYPDLIAAVYSGSGAWFNDPGERRLIHAPLRMELNVEWNELSSQPSGAVLMTYGSPKDAFNLAMFKIINFHDAALLARDFLPSKGRTAVFCEHDDGHRLHPLIAAEEVVRFFSVHKAGKPSPYRANSDLPRFLSNACQVLAPN